MDSKLSRMLCTAILSCALAGCGIDPPPPSRSASPPPPAPLPPSPVIRLSPGSLSLTPGEQAVVTVTVEGIDGGVAWGAGCESGDLTLVPAPDGSSVTVRANAFGTCYLWADVDSYGANIPVRARPVPFANGCSNSSDCAADAPLCLYADGFGMCGRTCTRQCKVDSDCPATSSCKNGRVCNTLNPKVVAAECD